jgi:large subunit ribosomal protein L9
MPAGAGSFHRPACHPDSRSQSGPHPRIGPGGTLAEGAIRMEVILLEAVDGLGSRGDRVQVARGFARNYLVPRKLAILATSAGARMFEDQEHARRNRADKERRVAELQGAKMKDVSVTLHAQVGEDEKLFGSITTSDIADALQAQGFSIDKRQVLLEEPLKVLGVYRVEVKLYQDVTAAIKVWVAKQEAE